MRSIRDHKNIIRVSIAVFVSFWASLIMLSLTPIGIPYIPIIALLLSILVGYAIHNPYV